MSIDDEGPTLEDYGNASLVKGVTSTDDQGPTLEDYGTDNFVDASDIN